MVLAKKAGEYDIDPATHMKRARETAGVGLGRMMMDYLATWQAGTKLTFPEYLFYELWRQPHSEYPGYMGVNRARAATYLANDMSLWDRDDEKLSFARRLLEEGLPQAAPYAFAHAARDTGEVARLRTRAEIAAFLKEGPAVLFGKPGHGTHGDGSVLILGREGDTLHLAGGQRVSADELAGAIAPYAAEGAEGYLFQEVLRPHPVIGTITGGRLGTLRVFALREPEAVHIRGVVLRLPAGANQVDNFRRAGNLLVGVNPGTSGLGLAQRGVGAMAERLAEHPDTGARIEGTSLPDLDAALDLVRKATALFPEQAMQSWDVALTDRGPALVEVNPAGQLNLVQLVQGRGLYDVDFRAFLEERIRARDFSQSDPKTVAEAKKFLGLR